MIKSLFEIFVNNEYVGITDMRDANMNEVASRTVGRRVMEELGKEAGKSVHVTIQETEFTRRER